MCDQTVWTSDAFMVDEERETYLGTPSSSNLEIPPDETFYTVPAKEHCTRPIFIGPQNRVVKDVKDENSIQGVCGLNNLGNTCFMNAGLQCLFNNSSLCQFMLEKYEKNGSSLARKFIELLVKVWSGHYSIINPADFKSILGLCHHQFQDHRQHDCQEFLALLLDSLHEQLNTANKNSEDSACQEASDNRLDVSNAKYSSAKRNDDMAIDSLSPIDESCESAASSEESVDTNKYHLKPSCEYIASKEIINKTSVNINEFQYNSLSKKSSSFQVENCNNLQWSPKVLENKTGLKENCYASCSSFSKLSNVNFKHNDHVSGERKPEKNELASKINTGLKLPIIEDFFKKDTKTLNTNVLVTEFSQTNIKYDSEKYCKIDNISRPIEHVQNLENLQLFDTNSIAEHSIKETNLLAERKGKLSDWNGEIEGLRHSENCYSINNIKRMKIDEKEKNVNMEVESSKTSLRLHKSNNIDEKTDDCQEKSPVPDSDILLNCEFPLERQSAADIEWEKYLSKNQSVVVDTFQGQFKSTVVCSECNHVSVTFEPFMYLSIPLPRAMEKQINITYVPSRSKKLIRYLVTLNKKDNIRRLKEKLKELIGLKDACDILIAEVLGSRISRVLDDNRVLRFVNDTSHSIYAFEMLPVLLPEDEKASTVDNDNNDQKDLTMTDSNSPDKQNSSSNNFMEKTKTQWHSCAICLEDMADSFLSIHPPCQCILCINCREMACKHKGSQRIPCPVCSVMVVPSQDFMPLDSTANYKPKIRILLVPVVFRLDYEESNTKKITLFSHPHMLYLPSKLNGHLLFQSVDQIVPILSSYSIVLTNSQGVNCARCNHTLKCTGCELFKDVDICLQPGDNLAITFADQSIQQQNFIEFVNDSSMENHYSSEPLDIYDCLKAFTQSEILDEHNPWYCPCCKKNQCARKTLSVWRYPVTLIVYLKRFVFHDLTSTKLDNKVIFPLERLDLSSFLEGPQDHCELVYDLQSCVCHFGGVNSGHYTAYAKHILSGEWYNYNDNMAHKQCPDDADYSNAYILFYQRSGFSCKVDFPEKLLSNGIDGNYSLSLSDIDPVEEKYDFYS